jgi:hypothetical protein
MATKDVVETLMRALQAQAARQRGHLSDAMARTLARVAIDTLQHPPSGPASADQEHTVAEDSTWEATGELRWYAERIGQPMQLQQAWRSVEDGQIAWRDVPLVLGQGAPQRE